MSYFRASLLCFTLSMALCAPAMAADDKQPKKNPLIEEVKAFSAEFPPAEKRHFNVIYSNYNIVQVVKAVQNSVEEASESCGDKNPEIEDEIEARFEKWNDEVAPIVKDALANINNMIIAQDYAKPKDIERILNKTAEAREEQEKSANKIPVTTLEACKALIRKMDKTQTQMVGLLKSTLVSLPRSIQIEDEAKAKTEAGKISETEEE